MRDMLCPLSSCRTRVRQVSCWACSGNCCMSAHWRSNSPTAFPPKSCTHPCSAADQVVHAGTATADSNGAASQHAQSSHHHQHGCKQVTVLLAETQAVRRWACLRLSQPTAPRADASLQEPARNITCTSCRTQNPCCAAPLACATALQHHMPLLVDSHFTQRESVLHRVTHRSAATAGRCVHWQRRSWGLCGPSRSWAGGEQSLQEGGKSPAQQHVASTGVRTVTGCGLQDQHRSQRKQPLPVTADATA
jgi:hypothetical protein